MPPSGTSYPIGSREQEAPYPIGRAPLLSRKRPCRALSITHFADAAHTRVRLRPHWKEYMPDRMELHSLLCSADQPRRSPFCPAGPSSRASSCSIQGQQPGSKESLLCGAGLCRKGVPPCGAGQKEEGQQRQERRQQQRPPLRRKKEQEGRGRRSKQASKQGSTPRLNAGRGSKESLQERPKLCPSPPQPS